MKKIIALILLTSMVFVLLCGCAKNKKDEGNNNDTPSGDTDNNLTDNNGEGNNVATIVVPAYKDYNRGSVNFSEIIYTRPDFVTTIDAFNAAIADIEANKKSKDEQIAVITALESSFTTMESMYQIAQIYCYKDASVSFWQDEFEYMSTNYPKFTAAVEDLLVACAKSPLKSTFESEYFGYSLDKYLSGGIYTDELVALLSEEARIESEYSSLSTANVEITYSSVSGKTYTGTVDEVYAAAHEDYKSNPETLERVYTAINLLYQQALMKRQKPLYIELIKVRRLIADELGYDSYVTYAYDAMGYDYSESDMLKMISDIGRYVTPVASELEYTTFRNYFQKNVQPRLNSVIMINTLYQNYSKLDSELYDAYCYMLQHGLYDVAESSSNRYSGAFTTYIGTNNSPYLFMTTSGFIRDYLTLAHEFGHFADGYVNNGADTSLNLAEVSSQGLELLTVLSLKSSLKANDYEYLEYYSMYVAINSTLLTQSFYSSFEHKAYELDYEDITEEALKAIVVEAATDIYGDSVSFEGDLEYVILPHTVLYPFYVESYVTSGLVALDIFFKESYRTGEVGKGIAIYKALITRQNPNLTFTENLERVGLDSPFTKGKVKEISNNIYYQIMGKNYYKPCSDEIGAA